MKISKYVYFYPGAQNKLGGSSSNTFLIFNKYGVLVDPGTVVGHRSVILPKQIKKDGINLSKIKEIWITHAHPDHIQLARILVARFGWRVRCHQDTRPIVDSQNPAIEFLEREYGVIRSCARELMPIFEVHLIALFVNLTYGAWHRTKVNGVFRGGEIIRNGDLEIKVLAIPGHCPIDIGFWLSQEKTLIMGDLIDPRRKQPVPVFNNPSSDLNQGIQSLELILSLQPKILGLGHGQYLVGQDKIKNLVKATLERMKSYKKQAADFLKIHHQYKLLELGRAIEKYRGLSQSGRLMLAFVVLKALKQDGLII